MGELKKYQSAVKFSDSNPHSPEIGNQINPIPLKLNALIRHGLLPGLKLEAHADCDLAGIPGADGLPEKGRT